MINKRSTFILTLKNKKINRKEIQEIKKNHKIGRFVLLDE
jgi:hypothetical protein